jgi:Fis family transcriptional regulator, factor for inversion stimulation protein
MASKQLQPQSSEIADCVRKNLEKYFESLDGARPHPIYDMVIRAVEKPVLQVVLEQSGHNQTVAAEILGINRNTLRKKLVEHKLHA